MQKYLTLKEVGGRLGGRSRASLYLDFKLGRLPKPTQIGGRVYIGESDLAAFLEAKRPNQEAA